MLKRRDTVLEPLARAMIPAQEKVQTCSVCGNLHTVNRQRLVLAAVLLALVPFADRPDALVTLAGATFLMCALITYEAVRFAAGRDQVRHAEGRMTPS